MLWEDRLPQAAVGVLAGAAFGASGAIFQRMLRNPLASPDVIGVGYGASAAAVAGMLFFGAQGIGLSLIACAGALAVALLIYAIADAGQAHRGAADPGRDRCRSDAAGHHLLPAHPHRRAHGRATRCAG